MAETLGASHVLLRDLVTEDLRRRILTGVLAPCPVAVDRCSTEVPPLVEARTPGHPVACHLVTPGGAPALTAAPPA
jgi:hypothetical protein